MLISNVHKSIIVMNSIDTRFTRNVKKTRSTCFVTSKITRLRLVVLNAIKHCCSFFKHYLRVLYKINIRKATLRIALMTQSRLQNIKPYPQWQTHASSTSSQILLASLSFCSKQRHVRSQTPQYNTSKSHTIVTLHSVYSSLLVSIGFST